MQCSALSALTTMAEKRALQVLCETSSIKISMVDLRLHHVLNNANMYSYSQLRMIDFPYIYVLSFV